MRPNQMLEELQEIKRLLSFQKEVLTLEEFCSYAGISKHQAYHLTSSRRIPFSRPFGKLIYIRKEDAVDFLQANLTRAVSQINKQSINNHKN